MELSSMDRYISAQKKRKQWIKKVSLSVSLPLTLAIAFFLFRNAVRPHLKSNKIETCIVEYGKVVETISTSGVVELEKKFIILAPSSTVLKMIKASPGQKVSTGDTILVLDAAPVQKNLMEGQFQLAQLKAKKLQSSLKYDNLILDQKFKINTKTTEISLQQIELEDQQALFLVGGSSSSKDRQAQSSMRLAKDELILMRKKQAIQLKELKAEMKDNEAEIAMKKMYIDDIKNQLSHMIVLSPVPGVVIEVNGETGSMVTQDKMLVKISDLRTYKITGKIKDGFSDNIKIGGKVIIVIDKDNQLPGTIGNIRPLVNEGQVYFDIFPGNKSHPRFRPNLNVEIRIVVEVRENTLRVKDGPFFDGSKKLRVYKIMGDKAQAVEVITGLINMEYIEILEGLEDGDKIVVSDISSIQSLSVVEIK